MRGHRAVRFAGVLAAAIWPVAAFGLLYFVLDTRSRIPATVGWLYVIASIVTFSVYFVDKQSARRSGRRISERTLLLLGLIGGWPGALAGQKLCRHKSAKRSFQIQFTMTVLLNVAVFAAVFWPRA